MIRFHDQDNFVELDLVQEEGATLPSRGDAYVTLRVSSAGFSGHNDLWVFSQSLSSFCLSLVSLERDRRGEAVLESISPGELSLRIRSVDRAGHMAIEGKTGYPVQREHGLIEHSVQFGFEFDPSQLLKAVKVDWVKRNAEPSTPADG